MIVVARLKAVESAPNGGGGSSALDVTVGAKAQYNWSQSAVDATRAQRRARQ